MNLSMKEVSPKWPSCPQPHVSDNRYHRKGAFLEVCRSESLVDDSDSSGILLARGCSIIKCFGQIVHLYEECQPVSFAKAITRKLGRLEHDTMVTNLLYPDVFA